jgi:protein O-GlcNAc transferase
MAKRASTRTGSRSSLARWAIVGVMALLLFLLPSCTMALDTVYTLTTNGPDSFKEAKTLFQDDNFDRASLFFWRAVLFHAENPTEYTVEEAFQGFMQCYAIQDKTAEGFVFIAKESYQRGQKEMATKYIEQALMLDPDNEVAEELKRRFDAGQDVSDVNNMATGDGNMAGFKKKPKKPRGKFQPEFGSSEDANPLANKSPEDLYEHGSTLFSRRNYEHCADVFELSCRVSDFTLGPACSNAVYCRMMITDWGFNGTGFDQDMERLATTTEKETQQWRRGTLEEYQWNRAASVHPHMMLGYPIDPLLKRYVAESVAYMDEAMARVSRDGTLIPLPSDMPFDPKAERNTYIAQAAEPDFKLHVGFISSGFNSKAVLYLSQDIFRFYDRSKIEMHIFSLGPPDNDNFIRIGMRGVDWRKRVAKHVDHFHDLQDIKMSHVEMARYIKNQNIHMLIEWDGYARQGERAQGLMALRPAPVQILHQEYLGTSGAQYVDYIFSDKITSPPHLAHLYTEKIIYLPNHFFSKGHAVQNEVEPPTYEYTQGGRDYELGTGSPEENRCLATGIRKPKFVFCNFNKFLKNNPETFRSWIRMLREVPDSILCLLENPSTGMNYLRRFVHEATGEPTTTVENGQEIPDFIPKDGDAINERIHFLPWERNPFDHQRRNQDFCNLMIDSYPYNAHTVAQDSLYAGVPIVTRSDGDDMSSRVTTSANVVLGLDELNAEGGPRDYENIAIELGNNRTKFDAVRTNLIDTALQRNPMHPYWDAPRYVKNIETGLHMAWDRFLSGQEPDHLTVVESEEAARGTYDELLINNPSDPVDDDARDEL